MASALCFHFFGNELARAASVSLISTKEIGLGSSALTYTVLFGFPASALTLYLYTSSIKYRGNQTTFRLSSLICLIIFLGMTYISSTNILRHKSLLSQFIVVAFYAFREIYSTLLSTQQWAFIVSALDHTTASYIVTFSGAVSIISTLGGISVEHVVTAGGVKGLLGVSSVAVLLTIASSELAFWSHTTKTSGGGDKSEKEKQKGKDKAATTDLNPKSSSSIINSTGTSNNHHITIDNNNSTNNSTNNNNSITNKYERISTSEANNEKKVGFSMYNDSMRLLTNSTLQLLVIEAVVHQSCSNMLNIMFYDGLRYAIAADDTRAVLVGRFFATVNFSSCLLQFFVVPYILSQKTLPSVMMYIPILVCLSTALCSVAPSLLSVMLSFGVLKVLEYAVLSGAMEMIYMPLDSETRYLGKEYVRFFGSKVGKTGASLALTTLTAHIRPSLTTQCVWSLSLAVAWAGVMTFLTAHLSDKISASDNTHSNTMPAPRVSESNLSTHDPITMSTSEEAAETVHLIPKSPKAVLASPIGSIFSLAWDEMSSVSRKRSRTMSVCDADHSFMFSPADILGALSEEDADTSDESEPSESQKNGHSYIRKRSTSSHSFPSNGLTDLTTSSSSNLLSSQVPSPRRSILRSLRRSRKRSVMRPRSRSEPLQATDSNYSSDSNLPVQSSASPRATSSTIPRSISGILRMSSNLTTEPLQGVPSSYEEYRALFGNMDSNFGTSCKAPISFSEFSNLVGMATHDSEASIADDQNLIESDYHINDGYIDIEKLETTDVGISATVTTTLSNEVAVELVPSVSSASTSQECMVVADKSVCDKTDTEPCESPDSLNSFFAKPEST